MSGMDVNGDEAPHDLDTDLDRHERECTRRLRVLTSSLYWDLDELPCST